MKERFFFLSIISLFCVVIILPTTVFAVTIAPTAGKVFIDSGKAVTHDREVILQIDAPKDAKYMMISNSGEFGGLTWKRYLKTKKWYLEYGARAHTVFVRFRLEDGTITKTIHDTITLQPATPAVKIFVPGGDVIDDRYLVVSTTLSNGIDAFRYGETKDLSRETFEDITDRKKTSLIVSAGSGKKIIYIDFKDAGGKIIQKIVQVTYKPSGRSIAEGSILYGQDEKYYYYGYDGRLHPFPNKEILYSWFPQNRVSVVSVSRSKIEQYKIGSSVCVRQGTYLLKFSNSKQVYIPDFGCVLYPIRSNVEATVLYGKNWSKRVIVLPSSYKNQYTFKSFDAIDKEHGVVDKDKDGVDAKEEDEYGTSDNKDDSDYDGLSDYEEINFWFSDPMDSDSDGDTYNDSQEILNGYNPIGPDKLRSIPSNTYTYPSGTMVRIKSSSTKGSPIYYVRNKSLTYSLGTKTNSKAFTVNYLQPQFIVDPMYNISLPPVKGSMSTKRDRVITDPYTMTDGGLKKL